MTPVEFYKSINGNYENVFAVLYDDDLILHFISCFKSDDSYYMLMEALKKSDIKACFEAAHRLKGVAASLGFTELYDAVNELSDGLKCDNIHLSKDAIQKVKTTYERLMCFINRLETDR